MRDLQMAAVQDGSSAELTAAQQRLAQVQQQLAEASTRCVELESDMATARDQQQGAVAGVVGRGGGQGRGGQAGQGSCVGLEGGKGIMGCCPLSFASPLRVLGLTVLRMCPHKNSRCRHCHLAIRLIGHLSSNLGACCLAAASGSGLTQAYLTQHTPPATSLPPLPMPTPPYLPPPELQHQINRLEVQLSAARNATREVEARERLLQDSFRAEQDAAAAGEAAMRAELESRLAAKLAEVHTAAQVCVWGGGAGVGRARQGLGY